MDKTALINSLIELAKEILPEGRTTQVKGFDTPNLPEKGTFELREGKSIVKAENEEGDNTSYVKVFVEGLDDSYWISLSHFDAAFYFGSKEDARILKSRKDTPYLEGLEGTTKKGGIQVPAGDMRSKMNFIHGLKFKKVELRKAQTFPWGTSFEEASKDKLVSRDIYTFELYR